MQPSANPSKMRCIVHRRCRIRRTRRSSKETSYLGSTPINRSLSCLALMMGLVAFLPARAELVVEITNGQAEAIPIAIVPFNSAAEAAGSFDVAQVVSDDLARSGRFKSMDRKDMIEQPHTGDNIGFDDCGR